MYLFFLKQVVQVLLDGQWLRGTVTNCKHYPSGEQDYEVSLEAPYTDLGPRWFNVTDMADETYCPKCHGYGRVQVNDLGNLVEVFCHCKEGMKQLYISAGTKHFIHNP